MTIVIILETILYFLHFELVIAITKDCIVFVLHDCVPCFQYFLFLFSNT